MLREILNSRFIEEQKKEYKRNAVAAAVRTQASPKATPGGLDGIVVIDEAVEH